MGMGTGIFLFALGAVLRFAVSAQVQGINIHTVGVILMVAGVAAAVVSAFYWQSWGGFRRGTPAATTTVVRERGGL